MINLILDSENYNFGLKRQTLKEKKFESIIPKSCKDNHSLREIYIGVKFYIQTNVRKHQNVRIYDRLFHIDFISPRSISSLNSWFVCY